MPIDDSHNAATGTNVFAIHGADPEVLAYAMAKYSRSALSLKESLREISSQRAEQFLNTFYFQYGHRSIADLAHLAFAVEKLSLLAAIVLVDEQRWDGQERSTRYQDFEKGGWHTPAFGDDAQRAVYDEAVGSLLASYRSVTDGVFAELKDTTTRPDAMKPEAFDRSLKARAFDVARYLLPLAANTSLGQIVNARTLEGQISRLLSAPQPEIQSLGEALRQAAAGTAWTPNEGPEVHVAPTLVKYAVPNQYAIVTRSVMTQIAIDLLGETPIAPSPLVDLIDDADTLELDLVTSLLYPVTQFPYRQIRNHVAALNAQKRDEIIEIAFQQRGRHDELLREFGAGQRLRFDILMDLGGFRDMHRHRRCTQLLQGFTDRHGWDTPQGLGSHAPAFQAAMQQAATARQHFAAQPGPTERSPEWSFGPTEVAPQYLLPLATRTRALFRMDFAEALYISELRSAPQGHISYRRVAWAMQKAVARNHPMLARYFRVTEQEQDTDRLIR